MTSNTFTTIQIRRSATAAAPTTLANGEFGFSFVSNTLYIGSPANTPIIVTSNAEIFAANIANNGLTNIAANGTITTRNTSQINFNNTATMNISTVANGTGTDVAWSANLTAIAGGVNNFQVDILANGSLTLGNANINFNNTSTVNVGATANGTGQANIALSVNTSAITNVISLNVSSNIANVGNLAVTQNIVTGNLSVTKNIAVGNITMNSISFIPVWTSATANASGTSASGQNCFTGTVTGSDTAGFWSDPFGIVHLRGLLANSGAGNIAAYAGSPAMNSNIANNFPAPTTNVYVLAAARCNGNGIVNISTVELVIYNNNAMQMINVVFANGQPATQALSWNIANISLYGITYSRV